MQLLIQFPTRERPEKFLTGIRQYQAMVVDINQCYFHVVIDADDATMNNETVLSQIYGLENCDCTISKNPGKINAINTVPPSMSWDILLLLSDDMIVQKKGWDSTIRNHMGKFYPDTDGVLWYNDGFVGNKLNTLVCMGRKYFDRFGYIYHPSYFSLWCDNEFTDVANALKRQTYIGECIIRHEHCIYTNQRRDALCDRNESFYGVDQKNYQKRKAQGFR